MKTVFHRDELACAAAMRRRAGFTLTEVIVGSLIITLVFGALTAFLSFARRSNSLTENRAACTHMARQAMEALHSKNYDDTLLNVGNTKRPLPGFANARGYYNVSKNTDDTVKTITVVVEWVEPWGMTRSVSLTTTHCRSLHY